MSGKGNVRFRVHIKSQQAQSINISKHPSIPTSINLNTNTSVCVCVCAKQNMR